MPRRWGDTVADDVDRDRTNIQAQMGPRPLSARALSKYAGDDDRGYEDQRGDQEQSADDLCVQGAAAMIAARIVF
jgi:hypothetical protein